MNILPAGLPKTYYDALESHVGELSKLQELVTKNRTNMMIISTNGKRYFFEFNGNDLKNIQHTIEKLRLLGFKKEVIENLIGKITVSGVRTFAPNTSCNIAYLSPHSRLHGNNNIVINSKHIETTGNNTIFVNSSDVETKRDSSSTYFKVVGRSTYEKSLFINCPGSTVLESKELNGLNSEGLWGEDCTHIQVIGGRDNTIKTTEAAVVHTCTKTTLEHCNNIKVEQCTNSSFKNTNSSSSFKGFHGKVVEGGKEISRLFRFLRYLHVTRTPEIPKESP